MKAITIAIILILIFTFQAPANTDILFEDFDDQDCFNNFSGNWGKLQSSPAIIDLVFDTANARNSQGASLKIEYDFSSGGGYGGLWNSILGKDDISSKYLNFSDIFGDLKNSGGNPTDVEDVKITKFCFWAKGNGVGDFYHTLKVELKDNQGNLKYNLFNIPNSTDWNLYEFPIVLMGNVDLAKMKQIVFVVENWRNNNRSSSLFIDDLHFVSDETPYSIDEWTDDQVLDLIGHRCFNYFLLFTDELDFAYDRSTFSDLVSVGAIGFQLSSYCIGHSRGWADGLETRVENIMYNLSILSHGGSEGLLYSGYKGFFYHFLNSNTGLRKNTDVELSLYDTMLMLYGVLTAKEYFNQNENIQIYAETIFSAVEWNWMVNMNAGSDKYRFHLAWKPESGFEGFVDGYTDEALLVDVLALGSTSHPVTMNTYNARSRFFGSYPQYSPEFAVAWTGSLFNYTFAACWLDLRERGADAHRSDPLDIWENNRRGVVANRQFCIDHADTTAADGDNDYTSYGTESWGLTACDNLVEPATGMLSEYYAFGALPTQQNIQYPDTSAPHLGTISVYGAGSSIVFLPNESISALRHFHTIPKLWHTLFGLGDSFSSDPHYFEVNTSTGSPILDSNGNFILHTATWLNGPWVNHMVMGIDVGPMLLNIENYRSGKLWSLTAKNKYIKKGLNKIYSKSLTSIFLLLLQ